MSSAPPADVPETQHRKADTGLIVRKPPPPKMNFLTGLRMGRHLYGRPYGQQVRDILMLSRGPARLDPFAYFLYNLADESRFDDEARLTFLSGALQRQLVARSGTMLPQLASDKVLFAASLQGLGQPTPETQAYLHPWRDAPGIIALRDADDLRRFLTRQARYPLFMKPSDAAGSVGVAALQAYHPDSDSLELHDGSHRPLDEIVEVALEYLEGGYLFQTLLYAHPDLAPIVGRKLASVRMIVVGYEDGPELDRAAWKIPVGNNAADNFWRSGNLLAGIDAETGRITRVMTLRGLRYEQVEEHPAKPGLTLTGWTFPHWDEMVRTVLAAARSLPWGPIQGWDVALTERGVVLMECEGNGGSTLMHNLCFDEGLYKGRFKEMAERALAEDPDDPRRRSWFRKYRDHIAKVLSLATPDDP